METFDLPFGAPGRDSAGRDTAARDIYTVARLNREVRQLVERALPSIWLQGEISNLAQPGSGHWYFSLKDSDAQVRCAMFRQRNALCLAKPRDGLLVLVRARVGLYEPRGEFQLVVEHLEEAGEGALRRQFEVLKARLHREGLFDPARKRPLPSLPHRIGVITSPTGAALRDILNILRRRCPAIPVLIYPVPVQGAGAPRQIAAAVALASRRAECDVLILARGGGSLEDLWAFNDERVARALAACAVPTVSGIGHEVDFTIADFVADVRAPTPSGAAELVVPDQRDMLARVVNIRRRMCARVMRLVAEHSQKRRWLEGRLQQCHPGVALAHQSQRLDDFEQQLRYLMRSALETRHAQLHQVRSHLWRLSPAVQLHALTSRRLQLGLRLSAAMRRHLALARNRQDVMVRGLNAVSPLATLERGYAIVTRATDDSLVRSADQLERGDRIRARVMQGVLVAVVEDKTE